MKLKPETRGQVEATGTSSLGIVAPPAADSPILALDVSSSATGYAYTAPGAAQFGLVLPRKADPAVGRIDTTVEGVRRLLARVRPGLVVMEWSSGRIHRRIRKATGLSVLGAAQGAVRQAIRDAGVAVETVGEDAWTASKPKASRAKLIRIAHPDYALWADEGKDKGLDAADALGLLGWWMARKGEAS